MDVSELNQIVITVPLPAKSLNPNARPHWSQKSRDAKFHRSVAKMEACKALVKYDKKPLWKQAVVSCEAFYPTSRERDGDNFIASMKSTFDGLADAGIIENDSGFIHMPPVFSSARTSFPRVEITITKKLQRIEGDA